MRYRGALSDRVIVTDADNVAYCGGFALYAVDDGRDVDKSYAFFAIVVCESLHDVFDDRVRFAVIFCLSRYPYGELRRGYLVYSRALAFVKGNVEIGVELHDISERDGVYPRVGPRVSRQRARYHIGGNFFVVHDFELYFRVRLAVNGCRIRRAYGHGALIHGKRAHGVFAERERISVRRSAGNVQRKFVYVRVICFLRIEYFAVQINRYSRKPRGFAFVIAESVIHYRENYTVEIIELSFAAEGYFELGLIDGENGFRRHVVIVIVSFERRFHAENARFRRDQNAVRYRTLSGDLFARDKLEYRFGVSKSSAGNDESYLVGKFRRYRRFSADADGNGYLRLIRFGYRKLLRRVGECIIGIIEILHADDISARAFHVRNGNAVQRYFKIAGERNGSTESVRELRSYVKSGVVIYELCRSRRLTGYGVGHVYLARDDRIYYVLVTGCVFLRAVQVRNVMLVVAYVFNSDFIKSHVAYRIGRSIFRVASATVFDHFDEIEGRIDLDSRNLSHHVPCTECGI